MGKKIMVAIGGICLLFLVGGFCYFLGKDVGRKEAARDNYAIAESKEGLSEDVSTGEASSEEESKGAESAIETAEAVEAVTEDAKKPKETTNDSKETAKDGSEDTIKDASGASEKKDSADEKENSAGEKKDSAGEKKKSSSGSLSALHVDDTVLKNEKGDIIQLKGVSTHGLAWYPQYVNEAFFSELSADWGANVVRLAMYTDEYGGYCNGGDQTALRTLIDNGISYATKAGMYVIVDWHILADGNPLTHQKDAESFFKSLSADYKDYDNIIYEICNEPNGGTSWADIKKYAQSIIPIIRANDEDAVILVGTPTWSQEVDKALADPLSQFDNIMYTLHFYAATHREDLRKRLADAVNDGLPVFVSEFGICDASGNGGIDEGQADAWISLLNEKNISYVAWALSNKEETAAMFLSSCNLVSGFGNQDLSASGRWVVKTLSGTDLSQRDTAQSNQGTASGSGEKETKDTTSKDTSSQDSQKQEISEQSKTIREKGELILDNGSFQIYLLLNDFWDSEGMVSENYSLELVNCSQETIKKWKITLVFDGDIADINGWNGSMSVSGSELTISNETYNGEISAGGSTGDLGFIITGKGKLSVKSCFAE